MPLVTSTLPTPASILPNAGITAKDWTVTYTNISWPLKNQGACGSCWAFSAVGVTEANVAIKNSAPTVAKLAEQHLVDCVNSTYGAYGCGGGWPASALQYMGLVVGGIASTVNYPYVSGSTKVAGICNTGVAKTQYLKSPWVASVASSAVTTQILSTTMSVAVYASGWNTYTTGIYSGCPNPIPGVNHGVVLVGVDANGNYKLRNSWGGSWAEWGNIRVSSTNNCGVLQYAKIPVLL